MKVSVDFGGRFWKADQLLKPVLLTIRTVTREAMMGNPQDLKWAVWFEEDPKGLVLNRTNAVAINSLYGDDSAAWTGQKVVLHKSTTEMQGRTVDCVRIRGPKQPVASPEDIPY